MNSTHVRKNECLLKMREEEKALKLKCLVIKTYSLNFTNAKDFAIQCNVHLKKIKFPDFHTSRRFMSF